MTKREIAIDYFNNGYNCAQSVVMAFSEDFGIDKKTAAMMSEGFGGGMGRMRLTCGAVTGMFFVVGLKYSKGAPKDMENRMKIYETVRKLSAEFESKMGSTVCSDLIADRDPHGKQNSCRDVVGMAAEILEKHLMGDM